MSLSDILNEISGDIDNINDNNLIPSNIDISKESICLFKEDLPSIDKKTLASLYKKEELLALKKIVGSSPKIDKSIVLEAMAALPIVDKVTEAKLTNAPSAINKKILDDIIYDGTDEVPNNWISDIRGLYEEISIRSKTIKELMSEVDGRYCDIEKIIDEKNLRDKELALGGIAGVEDWKKTIEAFKVFKDLINTNQDGWYVKGKDLLDLLYDVRGYVRSNTRVVLEFEESARLYLDNNPKNISGEFSNVIRNIENVYTSMDGLNKIAGLVKGEDSAMGLILLNIEKME